MIESFSVVVGGAMLIALVAAIFVGIAICFCAFVIAPIFAILCCIFGWDKQDKKEEPVEENL